MSDTAEPPQPRRARTKRRLRVALVIVALVATVIVAAASFFAWGMGGSAKGEPVKVVIPQGANAAAIASLLAEKHVIRSAFVFRVIARLRGVSGDFKPGAYDMRSGLGVSRAIDTLRTGIPEQVERFTIPEGLTVIETAHAIARQTHITEAQFLSALTRATDIPA
ncbi:MAG: endolytic transglycosylase MltG, partial [Actinomycetota bacterium]